MALKKHRWMTILLCVFGLTFLWNSAMGSHARGVDFYYEHVTGNTYKLTLKFYKDCGGAASAPFSAIIEVSSSCDTPITFTLPKTSFTDVSQICAAEAANTTCDTGTFPGTMEHVYEGTYTLTSVCSDWTFSFTHCCRNAAVTNLSSAASYNIYSEIKLDNTTQTNNSVQLNNNTSPYYCIGDEVNYNLAPIDPDGDSLTFELVNPKSTSTQNIPYVSPYTPTDPFATDSGFFFNSSTGQIRFSTSMTQIPVISVLVNEYRNGVWVGSVTKDIQFILYNCGTNKAPYSPGTTDSTYNVNACYGGYIIFDVPSADPDVGDVVDMTFAHNLPSSPTITITGSPPTMHFEWYPSSTDSGVYSLTVFLEDDACPIPGINSYNFTLIVDTVISPLSNIDVLQHDSCGGGVIQLEGLGGSGDSVTWFENSGCTAPSVATGDVFTTTKPPGTYYFSARRIWGYCYSNCIDTTIYIGNVPSAPVAASDVQICPGSSASLTATGSGTNDWYSSGCGTGTYIGSGAPSVNPSSTTQYYVQTIDGSCRSSCDSMLVEVMNGNPIGIVTWTGNDDEDWHNCLNWNPTVVPTEDSQVIVPGATSLNPIIYAPRSADAYNLEINSDNGANLEIQSTGGAGLQIHKP